MLRALVLQRHEVGDELALVDALALLQREGHRRIGLDRADTVDARHRGDDHHVVAFEQRARRRVAHAVDLLVDRGFFLDVGVGARHVGLGLVVVVIRDEILHRVVGKEAPELAIELRRERLVRREDQRGALRRLDHLRHREGLARAGDAEQHLIAVVALHALDQFLDRGRLVALRLEVRLDDEALAAFGFLRARGAMRRPHARSRCGIRRGPRAAARPATPPWRRRPSSDIAALDRRRSRFGRSNCGSGNDTASPSSPSARASSGEASISSASDVYCGLRGFGEAADLASPSRGGRTGATDNLAEQGLVTDFRARCAAEKSSRRSHELLAGGCRPVFGSFSAARLAGQSPAARGRLLLRVQPGLRPDPRGSLRDAGIEQLFQMRARSARAARAPPWRASGAPDPCLSASRGISPCGEYGTGSEAREGQLLPSRSVFVYHQQTVTKHGRRRHS